MVLSFILLDGWHFGPRLTETGEWPFLFRSGLSPNCDQLCKYQIFHPSPLPSSNKMKTKNISSYEKSDQKPRNYNLDYLSFSCGYEWLMACKCLFIYIYLYTRTPVYIYKFLYLYIHTCIYIHIFCLCISIYIHILYVNSNLKILINYTN